MNWVWMNSKFSIPLVYSLIRPTTYTCNRGKKENNRLRNVTRKIQFRRNINIWIREGNKNPK
jgi:hypothetical protein